MRYKLDYNYKNVFYNFLDKIYPRNCGVCDQLLDQKDKGGLCLKCIDKIPKILDPYCSKCGEKFDGNILDIFKCPNCVNIKYYFDYAYAGSLAKDDVRELVLQFKYSKQRHLRKALCDIIIKVFSEPRLERENTKDFILVPVPLYYKKEKIRGFNQAEEICDEIKLRKNITKINILKRIKNTFPQANLSRKMRITNPVNAFSYKNFIFKKYASKFSGKIAVIVDDVFTTGSTVNECAKILKKYFNFKKIIVITVARG